MISIEEQGRPAEGKDYDLKVISVSISSEAVPGDFVYIPWIFQIYRSDFKTSR